ncbi:Pef1 [Cordylochernes scorpioides]|uniref:Peflin n=1 Tax=Cordylochernes scorpioides TaxID=51811 RepID=A0ABY6KF82_9ARAC|nr:Pef1 [Cordylochernes scorpioides]
MVDRAAPPPGITQELYQWFRAVDQDNSGSISARELQQALVNGNWSPFNQETCRLMIGMFDNNKDGTIDLYEFKALWDYIHQWKQCFDSFDLDRSGTIDVNELSKAFQSFGYRLSPNFCQIVISRFDRVGRGTINFDDFIQSCVMLKSLTDAFRSKDRQQTGMVTMYYEEFLTMVLDNTLLVHTN